MSQGPQSFDGGRYQVVTTVGQGGVGTVYLAEQQPLGRQVALKVLREEFSGNLQVRRRFSREARAAAGLIHPNIATVFDFGAEDDGTLYLAMEFVRGRSLADYMLTGLTPRELLAIIGPILSALAYSHARGVIHRDLKPDNILIANLPGANTRPAVAQLESRPELIKLVDFGIATTVRGGPQDMDSFTETGEGTVVGTPLYMSPEQARGGRILTPASDLYAIGVLLFEGLTGRHPFAGLSEGETPMDIMIRHVSMPAPPFVAPPGIVIPDVLRDAVMRCLRKVPAERFTSAAELKNLVVEATGELRGELTVAVASGASDTHMDAARVTDPERPWTEQPPGVRLDVPLVARQRERLELQAFVRRAAEEGVGQVILLEGEAGVGKTRIATWLAHGLAEAGAVRWVQGAFLQDGGGLRGIRDALEALYGVRHLPLEQARRLLASAGGDLLVKFLRPDDEAASPPPRGAREALFALLVRVMEATSAEAPLLILLDDVHWAGPELGELLEYVAVEARYRSLRVCFVCTLRPEDMAANRQLGEAFRRLSRYEGETVERVTLSRFGEGETRALIQQVLPASPSLEEHVLHRSAGNALHVIQLLRFLHHEGALQWNLAEQRYELDRSRAMAVPPGLADLLLLRVRQIETVHQTDGALHDLLERCAVLGEQFLFDTLAAMSVDLGIGAVDDGVDALLQEGVLRSMKGQGVDLLGFDHALLHEALLEQLAGTRRLRRLHELAGAALESTHSRDLDGVAQEIARHAEAAGQTDRAHAFYLRAGNAARRGRRVRDALGCYERALEAAPNESAGLLLARRIGDLLYRLGDFSRAERMFRDVRDFQPDELQGEDPEQVVRASFGLGKLAQARGDQAVALDCYNTGIDLAVESGLGKWVRAGRIERLKLTHQQGDLDLAEQEAEAILIEAARTGDGWGEADAMAALARLLAARGSRRSDELAVRAQELFASLGSDDNVAAVLRDRAQQARTRGDAAVSARLFAEARTRFEALGDRAEVARCLNGLGDVARQLGRLGVARSAYARALETFRDLGARSDLATALVNLGMTELAQGDLDAAEGYLAEAEQESERLAHPYITLGITANLTLVRARRGDWDTVEAGVDRLLPEFERLDIADPDYAGPLREVAELATVAGRNVLAERVDDRAQRMWAALAELSDAEDLDDQDPPGE
jgi:eukaryotic-like serine/threonine-protein kinase